MKLKFNYLIIFSLLLFFSSCKKTEKTKKETEIENTTKTALDSNKIPSDSKIRNIPIEDLQNTEKSLRLNKKESYIKDGKIHLNIYVPNEKFHFVEKHNVSSKKLSAIVYVISDDTRDKALKKPVTHKYDDKISLSFIGGSVLGGEIVVFVVNDHPDDFPEERTDILDTFRAQIKNGIKTVDCKEIDSFIFEEPKEQCGGVIVE